PITTTAKWSSAAAAKPISVRRNASAATATARRTSSTDRAAHADGRTAGIARRLRTARKEHSAAAPAAPTGPHLLSPIVDRIARLSAARARRGLVAARVGALHVAAGATRMLPRPLIAGCRLELSGMEGLLHAGTRSAPAPCGLRRRRIGEPASQHGRAES